jgi:hypothetical protein
MNQYKSMRLERPLLRFQELRQCPLWVSTDVAANHRVGPLGAKSERVGASSMAMKICCMPYGPPNKRLKKPPRLWGWA